MKRARGLVVAIDGPAGAGKSTVARAAADLLGYTLVDTGALYRAVALAAIERAIPWHDGPALGDLAASLDLGFVGSALHIDGVDRSSEIRSPTVSQGASIVSQHPEVRRTLLGMQRKLGDDGGVVLEGRDIGTVVFPDAEVKVFLTASDQERARRRHSELALRGGDAALHEVLRDLQQRDQRDSSRPIAPLRPADDAVRLDTTGMELDAVVGEIVALVASRASALNGS